jgi:hypothetical protein
MITALASRTCDHRLWSEDDAHDVENDGWLELL